MREEMDEITGLMQLVIIEQREKTLLPKINIVDKAGKKPGFAIRFRPARILEVRDGIRSRRERWWRRFRARSPRPATSPAVCRAWRSCSKSASRATRRW